jgi:gliding motility-associated lipoprotein GldH
MIVRYFSTAHHLLSIFVVFFFFSSCDTNRVYEDNVEFKDRSWKIAEPAQLEFYIQDTAMRYNLYLNIRNSIDYPYSRLFVNYSLQNAEGKEISKKMISEYLFDQKTGQPKGNSGLGDLYDHEFIFLMDHAFMTPGKYKVKFEQFMRQDTLQGIIAVGLRVERKQ